MQTRFILGPAGSGKTFRCLAEIRRALTSAPEGPPLLLLAPKQTTYQLERQLLAQSSLQGYTRLHILSFERLARFAFDQLRQPPPRMLDEEGRLMVLRALLAKQRDDLKLFRASARLTGFARHLSLALRELQRQQQTPESLRQLAEHAQSVEGLADKLHDLAALLRDYLDWLAARQLQDADQFLDLATKILRQPHPPLGVAEIWVDGFAELSLQELALLAEVAPSSERVTLTFCLERVPAKKKVPWLSHWAVGERMYHRCHDRLAGLPNCPMTVEILPRDNEHGRFGRNPVLRHLEANWETPRPLPETVPMKNSVRLIACADPDTEATLAAREILRFVHDGGRYREITILTRDLPRYYETLANVFHRYEIPFFLDRRESVSHHPLAELTRNALRTVVQGWARDDWFAALKTGLVPATEAEIDRLENEALARGWKGTDWQKPIAIADEPELTQALEQVRLKIMPPFNRLALRMAQKNNRPNGADLAEALREFWLALRVDDTLQRWSVEETDPRPIHRTVWEQMSAWLDNLELAFANEPLPLREWLPILEAGLTGLTVGVIPPALDQVLVGAIDRSRNPDIRLAIVLGMNEGVFPAPPVPSVLLTDTDREALEREGVSLPTHRQQMGQERHYAYVAATRAREKLLLTWCAADDAGKKLNPSPFLWQFKQLFPALETETGDGSFNLRDTQHATELIAPLLRNEIQLAGSKGRNLPGLDDLPVIVSLRERLRHLIALPAEESLAPALAARLYGPALRTSVSRMEEFAACPFKFFVHSGLHAEERRKFELDIRDQGNFQHEVLATFHDQLKAENKRWRELTPEAAREQIKAIALDRMRSFRDGLLQLSDEARFTAGILTESLQDFVETLVHWMRGQYAFEPMAVELPFGDQAVAPFPPWEIDLAEGHRLLLHGRIDRIDIYREPEAEEALCVVVDYKSSQKQLDPLLMEHGLQLQLPAYLNVLRRWQNPETILGVRRLVPAGVFYVNLRGKYERRDNRNETLQDAESARNRAYRHSGRFDANALGKLDQRTNVTDGDQFNYRLTDQGKIHGNSREALAPEKFLALLDAVETSLQRMGRAVYAGVAKADPYRKGNLTACDQCDYRSICRIDPWTHSYRVLRKKAEPAA